MARKKNKKGFTLIELIVVIAIIGILSAVIVPSYLGFVEKAKINADRKEVTEIVRAIELANIMGPIEIEDGDVKVIVSVKLDESGFTYIVEPTEGLSLKDIVNAIYKAKNEHELNVDENDIGIIGSKLYYRNQSSKYTTYDFKYGVYGLEEEISKEV